MAAKAGSFSFDFSGVYTEIKPKELLAYNIDGGRITQIIFTPFEKKIKIVETFEAEKENPMEMQQQGWQNILDHFKKYVESTIL